MECKQCGVGRIKSGFFGKPKCDNCGAAPSQEDLRSQAVVANDGTGDQSGTGDQIDTGKQINVSNASTQGDEPSALPASADSPIMDTELGTVSAAVSPSTNSQVADVTSESRTVGDSHSEDSQRDAQDQDESTEPPKWIWVIPWVSTAGAVGWLVYWCNLWLLNEDQKLRGQVHASTLSYLYLGIAIGGLVPFVYAFLKTINRQATRDAFRKNKMETGTGSVAPTEAGDGDANSSFEGSVNEGSGSKTTLNDALISFWVAIRPLVGVLAIIVWEIFWFYMLLEAEDRPSVRQAASRYRGEHIDISFLGMLCLTMVLFGWVPLLAIFAIGPTTTTVSEAKGDKKDDETLGTDSDAAADLLKSLDLEEEVLDIQDVLAVDDDESSSDSESDVGVEPKRNPYTGEILLGDSADDVKERINDQLAAASGMSKVDSGGFVKGAAITFGLLIFGWLFLNLMDSTGILMDSTGILSAILLPVGMGVFVIYLFVSGSLRY
ncbi:MAG: hypothetical protein ACON4H_06280 [Rubripirellula sp.]